MGGRGGPAPPAGDGAIKRARDARRGHAWVSRRARALPAAAGPARARRARARARRPGGIGTPAEERPVKPSARAAGEGRRAWPRLRREDGGEQCWGGEGRWAEKRKGPKPGFAGRRGQNLRRRGRGRRPRRAAREEVKGRGRPGRAAARPLASAGALGMGAGFRRARGGAGQGAAGAATRGAAAPSAPSAPTARPDLRSQARAQTASTWNSLAWVMRR
jgi:hypothetical protein